MNLVAWSGGCDSTLVIFNLCRNRPDERIKTIAVNHYLCDENHTKVQTHARKSLLSWFGANDCKIDHMEINVEASKNQIDFHVSGLGQPGLWIMMLCTLKTVVHCL